VFQCNERSARPAAREQREARSLASSLPVVTRRRALKAFQRFLLVFSYASKIRASRVMSIRRWLRGVRLEQFERAAVPTDGEVLADEHPDARAVHPRHALHVEHHADPVLLDEPVDAVTECQVAGVEFQATGQSQDRDVSDATLFESSTARS
jgi:hypothetical protein